jgi:hypothetical protein
MTEGLKEKSMSQLTETSKLAGHVAAGASATRRERILALLSERPRALFELAEAMGVGDHQISGVITGLASDLWIERTGERRLTPRGCQADVWRIAGTAPTATAVDDLYPLSLAIDGMIYERQPLLPAEGYPGMPYAERRDIGAFRRALRIQFISCPKCDRPLRQIDATKKLASCGNSDCATVWRTGLATEPGRQPCLVLVMVS